MSDRSPTPADNPPPLPWWKTAPGFMVSLGVVCTSAGAVLLGEFREFERQSVQQLGAAIFWGVILVATFIVGNFLWMLIKESGRSHRGNRPDE